MHQNRGKPIFDPFAGATEIEIRSRIPETRREYRIFRPCGHCLGNGRRKKDSSQDVLKQDKPECSQCLLGKHEKGRIQGNLFWGRFVYLLAYELTESESQQLKPEQQLGARYEQLQHQQKRHLARIACEPTGIIRTVTRSLA